MYQCLSNRCHLPAALLACVCLQGGEIKAVLIQSWFTRQWNASGLLVMAPGAVISNIAGTDAACGIAVFDDYTGLVDSAAALANTKPDSNIFLGANLTLPPFVSSLYDTGHVTLNTRMRVSALPGWPGPSYLSSGFSNEVTDRQCALGCISLQLVHGTSELKTRRSEGMSVGEWRGLLRCWKVPISALSMFTLTPATNFGPLGASSGTSMKSVCLCHAHSAGHHLHNP